MTRTTRRRLIPALALAAALLIALFALAAANGGVDTNDGVDANDGVGVNDAEFGYVTAKAAGTTEDGVDYGTNDILIYDGNQWGIYFDGDYYGLESGKHKITAIDRPYEYFSAFGLSDDEVGPDDTYFYEEIYMVFDAAKVAIPSWPALARGHDVVGFWRDEYYDAGLDTTYSGWSFYPAIDGSDIGLTTQGERIDGLYFYPLGQLNGDAADFAAQNGCVAWALISTNGDYRVPFAYGGTLKGGGEDVLELCVAQWEWQAGTTEGYWYYGFDNSEAGAPKNAVIAIDYDEESDNGSYYFMTKAQFNAFDAVGGHSEIFRWNNDSGQFEDPFHDFNGPYPRLNGTAVGLDLEYSFTCSVAVDC